MRATVDTYRRAAALRPGDIIRDPIGKRGAVLAVDQQTTAALGSRSDVEVRATDVDTGEARVLVLHGDYRVCLSGWKVDR